MMAFCPEKIETVSLFGVVKKYLDPDTDGKPGRPRLQIRPI